MREGFKRMEEKLSLPAFPATRCTALYTAACSCVAVAMSSLSCMMAMEESGSVVERLDAVLCQTLWAHFFSYLHIFHIHVTHNPFSEGKEKHIEELRIHLSSWLSPRHVVAVARL